MNTSPSTHICNLRQLRRVVILSALLVVLTAGAQAQYKSIDILDYSYAQFSSSDEASIDLYSYRSKVFAILIFLPVDSSQLPAASQGSDGVYRLYYRRERLPAVIDQLRNESPLVLNFWIGPSGPDNTHISTLSAEPVGEGE